MGAQLWHSGSPRSASASQNRRLAAVGSIRALASVRASPGARRHYNTRGAAADWNRQAQRHLFNKFLSQLPHGLHTGQIYNEHSAFSLLWPSQLDF
jgi:hypothetical protein